MQRHVMQPIYNSDRAFYDKHILYQFLGISRHASRDQVLSQLAKERNVKKQFQIQQQHESTDLEAKIKRMSTALEREKDFQIYLVRQHSGDLKDLYTNFERAKMLLVDNSLRNGYDRSQDCPGDPPLPPVPTDYYESFPQPSFLPTFAPPSDDPPPQFLVQQRDPAVRRSAHSLQGHRAHHHHRQPPPNPPAPEMTGTILAHHSRRP